MKIQFIALCLTILSSCSTTQNKTNTIWKEVVGTVYGPPRNREIIYEVDGKSYKNRFYHSPYGLTYKGEKYILKYDVANPNNINICYSCPVFLETEKTVELTAKVLKIINFRWPFGTEYSIRFEYEIQGSKIRKEQDIPLNYKELYPNLKVGQYYSVECWVEDAQRSIIRLDKPVRADL